MTDRLEEIVKTHRRGFLLDHTEAHLLISELDRLRAELSTLKTELQTASDSELLALRNNEKLRASLHAKEEALRFAQEAIRELAHGKHSGRAYANEVLSKLGEAISPTPTPAEERE